MRIKKFAIGLIGGAAIVLASAAAAQADTQVHIWGPSRLTQVDAYSSQSNWTNTVSVDTYLNVYKSRCATLYEQGYNSPTRHYGSWQPVGSSCAGTTNGWTSSHFHFSVSAFYSDSVAVKICDSSGCASQHVWG